mmetsp:Transcript_12291/g.40873  ORF Transcript_12291/g.40873 Transcript_12291/m.40873 type:complete len:359 (+) Transcript_12291:1493-2569(+)
MLCMFVCSVSFLAGQRNRCVIRSSFRGRVGLFLPAPSERASVPFSPARKPALPKQTTRHRHRLPLNALAIDPQPRLLNCSSTAHPPLPCLARAQATPRREHARRTRNSKVTTRTRRKRRAPTATPAPPNAPPARRRRRRCATRNRAPLSPPPRTGRWWPVAFRSCNFPIPHRVRFATARFCFCRRLSRRTTPPSRVRPERRPPPPRWAAAVSSSRKTNHHPPALGLLSALTLWLPRLLGFSSPAKPPRWRWHPLPAAPRSRRASHPLACASRTRCTARLCAFHFVTFPFPPPPRPRLSENRQARSRAFAPRNTRPRHRRLLVAFRVFVEGRRRRPFRYFAFYFSRRGTSSPVATLRRH